MRYEFRREYTPYIGIDWVGKYGETADMAMASGAHTRDTNIVVGLRMWYRAE